MRVRIDNIVRRQEWIALAVGLAVAATIYCLLIQPSMQSFANHDHALAMKREAEQELTETHLKIQALEHKIADGRKQLTALGGTPPSIQQKDERIGELTALASHCGVLIDEYSPIDTLDANDYQSVFIRFTGRAEFQTIHRFFQRAESDLNYLDVTHFSINAVQSPGTPMCQVNWTCRISGMSSAASENDIPAHVRRNGTQLQEVAFHGR